MLCKGSRFHSFRNCRRYEKNRVDDICFGGAVFDIQQHGTLHAGNGRDNQAFFVALVLAGNRWEMNSTNGLNGYSDFNPEWNQAEYGTPRLSGYGAELRSTPPMMMVDWYPTAPYLGNLNYESWQFYANSVTEAVLAQTQGYGGIAPLSLQPLVNAPEPYMGEY